MVTNHLLENQGTLSPEPRVCGCPAKGDKKPTASGIAPKTQGTKSPEPRVCGCPATWIKPILPPIIPKQPCLRPDCIKKELQYSQSIQQNK